MIQAAVFDMDGTILDTLEDLTDSVNTICEMFGFPTHSISDIRRFVGNGSKKLIERALPAGTPADVIKKVHDAYVPYYRAHSAIKTRPYDGIVELLKELKDTGVKLAVVSNKGDATVKDLCEVHFPGLFDVAVGAREGLKVKPYSDLINLALSEMGIGEAEKNSVLYIGDSEVDYQTAVNAGLKSVNVLWGFRDRDFLQQNGVTVFANTAEELAEFFRD